ncbi:MAG: hypothetical protein MZV64_27295 [Ignavibacteriales bacterium]|nr:hypothetical protein [Ignavibacteriales bacterium]
MGGSDYFDLFEISWHQGTPEKTDDACSPKSDNPVSWGRDGVYCMRADNGKKLAGGLFLVYCGGF